VQVLGVLVCLSERPGRILDCASTTALLTALHARWSSDARLSLLCVTCLANMTHVQRDEEEVA
jgi:hypothetical protein